MLLTGKAAIVTGAGRGIGRAVAQMLASEGARVVVNDTGVGIDGLAPDATPAADTVDAILAEGGEAVAHQGSVAEAEDVEAMVETCIEAFGRIDILVNNAGIIIRNLLVDTPAEDWDRQVAVHLRGSYLTAHYVAPHMMRQRWGRIINFTSTSGLLSFPGSSAYASAKSGVLSLTRVLAQELVFYGITVNAIAPSAATRMNTQSPESVQRVRRALGVATRGQNPPSERPPEAVAAAVAYLASDEADYVNGQVLGVSSNRVDLWSAPVIEKSAFNDAPWTVASLRERFPGTVGQNLANSVPKLES